MLIRKEIIQNLRAMHDYNNIILFIYSLNHLIMVFNYEHLIKESEKVKNYTHVFMMLSLFQYDII